MKTFLKNAKTEDLTEPETETKNRQPHQDTGKAIYYIQRRSKKSV
jgi:hypothetical protein